MTREEREAIRERYTAHDPNKYPCRAAFSGSCPSGNDVRSLLAALDEAEENYKELLRFTAEEQEDGILTMFERDHWEARAKALERAMRDSCACAFCINESDCGSSSDCPWQFDEERFSVDINNGVADDAGKV